MVAKVFISYRRDDSAGYAGRVHDRLAQEFGPDLLFMDVDSISLGVNFVKVLHDEVAKCDVLLAVIGANWLNASDEDGHRRLDNPHDFVRVEIAAALQRDIPVIPILLDGARIPKGNQLPAELADLVVRNGLEVRHASFHSDMDRLIRSLKKTPGEPRTEEAVETPKAKEVRHIAMTPGAGRPPEPHYAGIEMLGMATEQGHWKELAPYNETAIGQSFYRNAINFTKHYRWWLISIGALLCVATVFYFSFSAPISTTTPTPSNSSPSPVSAPSSITSPSPTNSSPSEVAGCYYFRRQVGDEKGAAVIAANSSPYRTLAESTRWDALVKGFVIRADLFYSPSTSDFTSYITQVNSPKIGTIIFCGPSSSIFESQAKQAGLLR